MAVTGTSHVTVTGLAVTGAGHVTVTGAGTKAIAGAGHVMGGGARFLASPVRESTLPLRPEIRLGMLVAGSGTPDIEGGLANKAWYLVGPPERV